MTSNQETEQVYSFNPGARTGQLSSNAWELIHFWHFQPARTKPKPIKLVHDPDRSDGWLTSTVSAFNQLGQYTSSPGRTGYCFTELAVFFPSGGLLWPLPVLMVPNHRGMARLSWPGWRVTQQDDLPGQSDTRSTVILWATKHYLSLSVPNYTA